MDELTLTYEKYKQAIFIQDQYLNRKAIGGLTFICSECGKVVTINGATSHSKIHPNVETDKLNFIKEQFHFYDYSVVSGKPIKYSNIFKKNRYIVVCDAKEYQKILVFVFNYEHHYKKCSICGTHFMKKTITCSDICSRKYVSQQNKNWWGNQDNQDKIQKRNSIISEKSKIYNLGRTPWNKGLMGDDYLRFYDKEDGGNSLLDAMKKSTFIPRTSIELKIEKFLSDNNFRFQPNWFFMGKQYDFLISFKTHVVILECDGDYWHKSKRKFTDINDRLIKRQEDTIKENLILDHIKQKDKVWVIVRLWEYDINNNFDRIKDILLNLNSLDDVTLVEGQIEIIKSWYNEQS